MLLSEAFNLYCNEVINHLNYSPDTEEGMFVSLKSFIKYIGDLTVAEIQLVHIRRWKAELAKKHLSTGTIRKYLSCLRVVLAYLKENGIVSLNPELVRLPKREDKPIDFLTPVEVALLIRTAGRKCRGLPEINRRRNMAIISLLFDSGIRISELTRLDRGCFYKSTFTVYGKGRKTRPAFINTRTEKYLDAYLSLRRDHHPALFYANQTGTRLTSHSIQCIVRELGLKAGLKKKVHPHIFRHSFATDLLFNNTNPRHVQRFLGHSSLETTQKYMQVVDEDLKAVYAAKHTV